MVSSVPFPSSFRHPSTIPLDSQIFFLFFIIFLSFFFIIITHPSPPLLSLLSLERAHGRFVSRRSESKASRDKL